MATRSVELITFTRGSRTQVYVGITGQNVTVSIVDDGLDMYSNDLKDNYVSTSTQ